jgi:hypothetical protein
MECPHKLHPESELVGELYFRLRQAGVNAKLEVSVPSSLHTSGFMRIDIGVLSDGVLGHAIECKRSGKRLGMNTRQAKSYRALREDFGIQIHFVNDPDDFDFVLRKILNETQSGEARSRDSATEKRVRR